VERLGVGDREVVKVAMENHHMGENANFAAELSRLLGIADLGSEKIRVGIDVVSISKFESQSKSRSGAAFIRTRFTENELAYCEDRPERLAARWAAKEAVVKAIGSGFRGIRPRDIDIRHESWGEPTVDRPLGVVWPYDSHRWIWSISLAHEGDAAIAIALAIVNQFSIPEVKGHGTSI